MNQNKEKETEVKITKLKIVVVDDAEFSRTTIVKILEEAGHEVLVQADSAQSALKSPLSAKADLFLIDVVMPEISGIELAKVVREQFENAAMIMMSSLNLEHIVIESIASGAIDFLRKPFTKLELLASVGRVTELKGLRG
jgi:two-component system, chemotaxis family, chemotaxis protein CheY